MPTVKLLNLNGDAVSEIELAEAVFGIEPNKQVLFDAVNLQRNSLRQGTHKTKGRAEVRGGGRKPWRQKGTGRARQGSIRAPQWRGGGIVFGPTPRSYATKLNRKVRRLAIRSILSQKVLDNELKVVENLAFAEIKTKEMVRVLNTLNLEKKVVFVVDGMEDAENAFYSLRNLQNCLMITVDQINVYDVMNSNNIVFTKAAAELAGEVLA
ncbi:MAG: 50S ribosomal protein L4 [Erysipelothrix sp.]|jgi:large subunit ribosomal protein L4|nr:50S ribosomal protein L4 [Erysipelothrix sp.]